MSTRFFIGLPPVVFVGTPVVVARPTVVVAPGFAVVNVGPVVIVAARCDQ